ncbi:hypothetical protein ACFQV8_02430 [Pseudonocardia benzenivorans]
MPTNAIRDISPSDRVLDYTSRFRTFLDAEVAPLEQELHSADAGTPWNPRLDDKGRMHPLVWEARREVQRRSAKAGLYNPHIPAELGGVGSAASRCSTSRSTSTTRPGWGSGSPRSPGPRARTPPSPTCPTSPAAATSTRSWRAR